MDDNKNVNELIAMECRKLAATASDDMKAQFPKYLEQLRNCTAQNIIWNPEEIEIWDMDFRVDGTVSYKTSNSGSSFELTSNVSMDTKMYYKVVLKGFYPYAKFLCEDALNFSDIMYEVEGQFAEAAKFQVRRLGSSYSYISSKAVSKTPVHMHNVLRGVAGDITFKFKNEADQDRQLCLGMYGGTKDNLKFYNMKLARPKTSNEEAKEKAHTRNSKIIKIVVTLGIIGIIALVILHFMGLF